MVTGPPTDAWLPPGPAAIAVGSVVHRRRGPREHRFDYPMTQIWIDPDRPEALFDRHRLWSHRRPAPARFRNRDLLGGTDRPLGPQIRRLLADGLGRTFGGPLRTLTQARIWGWVFNPLTVHLAWDDDLAPVPAALLLEVTNTPWKERHCYPVALEPSRSGLSARFAKELHVSPFLDLDWTYSLRLNRRDDAVFDLSLDVDRPGWDDRNVDRDPVVATRLVTRLLPADSAAGHRAMTAALRPDRLPTHRVSYGIHRQALTLWRKRIPFVAHPARRS